MHKFDEFNAVYVKCFLHRPTRTRVSVNCRLAFSARQRSLPSCKQLKKYPLQFSIHISPASVQYSTLRGCKRKAAGTLRLCAVYAPDYALRIKYRKTEVLSSTLHDCEICRIVVYIIIRAKKEKSCQTTVCCGELARTDTNSKFLCRIMSTKNWMDSCVFALLSYPAYAKLLPQQR